MKKFLSMALALAMTLSLCTFLVVTEAGADFTDSDQLSNKYAQQAADVIQTIEVMDGYDDGSFRPTAGLTRQAAAKIICNMILGPTTAKALPTNANPFPDVLAGNQFSGYISYCSQQGIISGYADGTFRGGDPLSGYAYLKMLLGALGYKSENEGFTGDNWKVNVAKLALGIGLNKGIDSELDGTTQVTREEAAIYAFNTLQADMVEYDSKNSLEINGVVFNMGGGNATPQTWNTSNTNANNINNATSDGANNRPIVQFAERYFDKLERFPNVWDTYTPDAFGRPSTRWFWKGVEIDTYPEEPDVTYTGNVSANTIYADLGMGSADNAAELYLNGRAAGTIVISRGNGDDIDTLTAVTRDKIGDGTIVEAYRNDAINHVTVCVINVWGGKVTNLKAATSKKDECVVLEVGQYDEGNAAGRDIDAPLGILASSERREFETTDFAEDDVVAYTYSEADNEIKTMYLLSPIEGSLTRRYQGKSVVLDGDTYNYSKNKVIDLTNGEGDLQNKNDYIVYVDDNGLVLWLEEVDSTVDQYALLERVFLEMSDSNDYGTVHSSILRDGKGPNLASESASVSAPRARILLSSGAERTVTLNESKAYRIAADDSDNVPITTDDVDNKAASNKFVNGDPAAKPAAIPSAIGRTIETIAPEFRAGRIVRYTVTSDGTYKLHEVSDTKNYVEWDGRTADNGVISATTTTDAVSNKTLHGFVVQDPETKRWSNLEGDSNTVFIVNDDGTYKHYTGVRNAPNVLSFATGGVVTQAPVAYAYYKNTVAKVVFILEGKTDNTSKDITFIAAPSRSKLVRDNDTKDYYEYNAVVKDEIVDIMVAADVDGTVIRAADGKNQCMILNSTTTNSDDIITSGTFESLTLRTGRAQGIKRVSGTLLEIKVDTNANSLGGEKTIAVADDVKVYYSDGDGNIERIEMSDVHTDGNDWVYYVLDDGEITNLFVQELGDDADDTPTTSTSAVYSDGDMSVDSTGLNWVYHYLPANAGSVNLPTVLAALSARLSRIGFVVSPSDFTNTSQSGNVITTNFAGSTYRITLASDARESCVINDATGSEGTVTVTNNKGSRLNFHSNETVKFTIQNSDDVTVPVSAVKEVRYSYTDTSNAPKTDTITKPNDGSATEWTFTLPSVANGTSVNIYVDLA